MMAAVQARGATATRDVREGLVQELFPDLSLQEREVVMGARNGFGYYCAPCWDKMFPLEDEE